MIKIQIKSISGNLLFEYEKEENTIRDTVLEAIKKNADLSYANLRSADLSYADLSSANLRSADLRYADLSSADLRSANLSYANLRSADLSYADLSSANLRSADISYANLRSANLRYAKKLEDSVWMEQCKRDILFILQNLKSEVPNLRDKIISGEINGTQYEGECACLIGTLGKNMGVNEVCEVIPFYTKGLHNFGEQFFYQIRKGDTPENSGFSKIALDLCDMVIKQK